MGRQRGPLKVTGTLGDINFYKSQDGYLVREKGGVDGKRIKNDPAFKRTRENAQEFGRAGKAGKLLRTAFRPVLLNSDNRVVSRLQKDLMKVIQADTVNARGMRNVGKGDATLLTDFEFNNQAPLGATFYAPYTAAIDRVSGELTVNIQAFSPVAMLVAPSGTTHFKIVSGGAAIDFEGKAFVVDGNETNLLPWDSTPTVVINHVNQVTPASVNPLFLLLGIEFYQEVNGEMYALMDGGFNCSCLVKIGT